jgi:hypothetical protein
VISVWCRWENNFFLRFQVCVIWTKGRKLRILRIHVLLFAVCQSHFSWISFLPRNTEVDATFDCAKMFFFFAFIYGDSRESFIQATGFKGGEPSRERLQIISIVCACLPSTFHVDFCWLSTREQKILSTIWKKLFHYAVLSSLLHYLSTWDTQFFFFFLFSLLCRS